MKLEQVTSASSKELVAFYNKHAEQFGKKPVQKFADRMTAEIRVKTMIEDLEAEETGSGINIEDEEEFTWNTGEVETPSTLSVCLGLAPAPYVTEGMKVCQAVAKSLMEDRYDGHTHCPHCGINLENGVGYHDQEVNGKNIKHEKFELCCLACGEEFGPAISGKREVKHTGETREAMITSLKLDRTITAYDENMIQIGVWPNACNMWKQHLDWMTSAQQDGLTSKLYKAAKKGEKVRVVVNGRTFELVNV